MAHGFKQNYGVTNWIYRLFSVQSYFDTFDELHSLVKTGVLQL